MEIMYRVMCISTVILTGKNRTEAITSKKGPHLMGTPRTTIVVGNFTYRI